MTELEKEIQQKNIEKERKYPFINFTDNRAEIRAIAIKAQERIYKMDPNLVKLKWWEQIPTIFVTFIQVCHSRLNKKLLLTQGSTSIIIGDIMEMGIDGMITPDADKDGNLTPEITPRSEFEYSDTPVIYDDEVPANIGMILREENCETLPIQFYENREFFKNVAMDTLKIMEQKYGVTLFHPEKIWYLVLITVLAFIREARSYLIEHKDDDTKLTINIADIIKLSITKEGGTDDEPVGYYLSIKGGQNIKLSTKDDELTSEFIQEFK